MPCCSSRDKHSRHCGVMGTFSPISSKLFVHLLMCELNHEEAWSSSQVVIYLMTWKGRVGEKFQVFNASLFCVRACSAFAQNTWLFVYICSSRCLCAHPLHSGVLLNERQWEAAVLPQGRPCSALVRVAYATAITIESRENVSGWCLKGSVCRVGGWWWRW